jgi:hypothetical protein
MGIAKLAIEQELRVSHEMFGLNYVIFARTTSTANDRTSAIVTATWSASS